MTNASKTQGRVVGASVVAWRYRLGRDQRRGILSLQDFRRRFHRGLLVRNEIERRKFIAMRKLDQICLLKV